MENVTNNPESLDGEQDIPSSSADGSGNNVSPSIAETLGAALGKTFPDDASALKAVKDTFSFVGKAGNYQKVMKDLQTNLGTDEAGVMRALEEIKGTDTSKFVSKDEFQAAMFYKDNPQYAEHRELIEALASKNNVSVEEAVNTDSFKKVFDKSKGYDELQGSRNVLDSNPRLGQVRTRLDSARTALKEGNHEAARREATAGVIEAFEN